MPKKAVKRAVKRIVKRVNPIPDPLKLALKELHADLKKLKKSKKRMQFQWYRTKKEHSALIKDLDARLKAIKKRIAKKK